MMTIENKIKKRIAEELFVDAERITNDADLVGDLGADSLDAVSLVMWAEDEFILEIQDAAAEKIVTVGDFVRYIQQHRRD